MGRIRGDLLPLFVQLGWGWEFVSGRHLNQSRVHGFDSAAHTGFPQSLHLPKNRCLGLFLPSCGHLGVAACVWAAELSRTDLATTGNTCPLTPGYRYETLGYGVVILASAPGCPSHGKHRHKGGGCGAVLALPHSQEAAGVVPVSQELFKHRHHVTAKCKVTLGAFAFVAAHVLEICRSSLRFPSRGKNMTWRSRSAVLRWEMGCFPPLAINLHKCQPDSF